MKPEIKITNLPELTALFREYAAVSRRGIAEDINQKSYNIVNSAFALTRIANKDDIKALFAPTGKKVIGHQLKYSKVRISKKEAGG